MNIKTTFFLAFIFTAVEWNAQTVTYSEHIAPIIYNHCTNCHRTGEIGPFPLTNYTEVAGWAATIQYVTEIGYMPPWKPDPTYRRYRKENFLSAEQKQQITDWVNQGMPQGNPALEPALPVFPTGSQVGVPDLVLSFAEAFEHQGNNTDEYRYFVIPTGLTEDKNIRSLEFRPGNKNIVHHTLIWEDTTGASAASDAATPEYGYSGSQGVGGNLNQQQLPGFVPGAAPVVYSNGITQTIHAGADLKLQMHYAPSATNEVDSSSINIFFEDAPNTRPLLTYIMLPFGNTLVNGPFIMLPNQVKEFHGVFTVPLDVSLFSIAPHCHKLAQHWKVYAVEPSGDTIPLINIREWDFNWQGAYQFQQLIKLTAGAVIHAFCEYDNTTNNINNPNNPPQLVTWGEGTTDEMFYLPISFLVYQEGDENIVFDDNTVNVLNIYQTKDKLYPVNPTPSGDNIRFGFTIGNSGNVSLKIYSLEGKLVKQIENNSYHLPGYHVKDLNVSDLRSGVYFLEMIKGEMRQTEKIIIAR